MSDKAIVKVRIQVPRMPNYLKDEKGRSYDVGELGDQALKNLAVEWGKALVAHAHERRRKNIELNEIAV